MLIFLAHSGAIAMAQSATASGAKSNAQNASTASQPAWSTLSAAQQAALKPLAPVWNEISANRKQKWIALSANFSKLTPAEQSTLHARMGEWAALSPNERNRARLNFAESRALSGEEKKAQWAAYQALTQDQKQKLAAQAASNQAKGAAPAVIERAPGKLASVPVTRSDANAASAKGAGRPETRPSAAAPSRP